MKIIIITFFCLLQQMIHSQGNEFHIYKDDRSKYFKDNLEKYQTYFGIEHLKDSLPSGSYFFHDEKKQDSLKSSIILVAHYKHGLKDSLFESFNYDKIKQKKRLVSYYSTFFLEGKKNGVEIGYNILYSSTTTFSMTTYNTYKNGLKDGVCISFLNGQIISIFSFENGELIRKEFQNQKW